MAEEFTLDYGGAPLKLTKSESLVALRPRAGMEGQLRTALSGMHGSPAGQERLGGFEVVDVASAGKPADDALAELRRNAAVAVGSHVYHTSEDGVPFVPTGGLFVVFKPEVEATKRDEVLDENGLEIIEARGSNELIVKTTAASPNPVKVASALQSSGLFEVAEPELATPGVLKAFPLPLDPLLKEQWHLRNTGTHRGTQTGFKAGADARVVDAWMAAETLGAPEVVVAVIDDGFDLEHPDLSGPGKVVHPWDFTRKSDQPVPDANTEDWHGTSCAGVAIGRSGGGGIVGAAPGATLMPVRWGPDLSDGQVEKWFDYVARMGASVVSCSWGAAAAHFLLGTRRQRAISRCATEGRGGKGCVVVFAAGNDSRDIEDPAGNSLDGFAIHPDVISVAASTSRDTRSSYSNFGDKIAICAPSSGAGGWGILTSDVTDVVGGVHQPRGYAEGDYTFEFGGTSSACPLVAGVCALVLTVAPDLTAAEVRQLLKDSARRIGPDSDYQNGHSRYYGYGCIDAEAAVRRALAARGVDAASPSSTATSKRRSARPKRQANLKRSA